jgi:hypothetical protein
VTNGTSELLGGGEEVFGSALEPGLTHAAVERAKTTALTVQYFAIEDFNVARLNCNPDPISQIIS